MTVSDSPVPPEEVVTETHERSRFEASEALREYRGVPPEVPVGGLPARDYERWRRATDDVVMEPEQTLERGWLELEYAMALMRGAIDPETEEPYDSRKINTAFEAARQFFARLAKDESVPLTVRMQARIALISVNQHQEIVAGKPRMTSARHYAQFLNGLRTAGLEMLREIENEPELSGLVHMLELMALMTELTYTSGWYLPAAPRQPWDMNMHTASRALPDVAIVIDRPSTSENDVVISSEVLAGFAEQDGPFAVMRTYLEVEVGFGDSHGSPAFPKGSGLAEKWLARKRTRMSLSEIIDYLLPLINAHITRLAESGVRPAEEVIVETSRVEEPVREVHPEVLWYLTEYSPSLPYQELAAQTAALEKRRAEGGLFADEQRVLGWMQLELAAAMALDVEETSQLDESRERFASAIDTFVRAQRMFTRARRHGEAHDALLAQAGADVYRSFYTSRNKDGGIDNYAVRRAVGRYIELVSEVFASASKVKVEPEQAESLSRMFDRAALILLQAVAHEDLRHLILPTPTRTNDIQDIMAFHLVLNAKANGYDIIAPVRIRLVDGQEIEVGDHEVFVGREALRALGSSQILLRELSALLGGGKASGSKAGKAKASKKPQNAASTVHRGVVRDFSEKLAYAISDAYEYEPK